MIKKNGKTHHTHPMDESGNPSDTGEEKHGADNDSLEAGDGESCMEESPPVKTENVEMEERSGTITPGEREMEKNLAALNERYIRLLAEYDNYRKRTAREMDCIADIASEKLVQQFLPILDNLDRATEHRNDKTTLEDYVKGIALIEEQLRSVLAQSGLQLMEVIGVPFDPAVHSAILQAESDEHGPGIIIAEAEKGYTLNGKVIRHPKVIVSK